jgi:hypothetical protein
MSKRFKGKICIYCGCTAATTMDHVFAREFFPVRRRDNLPKVPACAACNAEKSQLEHYLTAVLPFGGKHEDAEEVLSEMVPPRLERNAKLKRALSGGHAQGWTKENGVLVPAMTVPFDSDRASELFRFITKGLLYHHWGVILDKRTHGVWAGFLNARGIEFHQRLLGMNSSARLREDIGNGTFVYESAQGTDIPEMSIWIFDIYGGLKLGGDSDSPDEMASVIGGVTASIAALEKLSPILA